MTKKVTVEPDGKKIREKKVAKPLKDQLLEIHDELTKAIVKNKEISKSAYGHFYYNFEKFFLRSNPKLLKKSKTDII